MTESQDGNRLLAARGQKEPGSGERKFDGQAVGTASNFWKKTV
ncbi:MAG: hypothetical protein GQF41_3182 [Candidatus Rifleibacterium amylolyticum]|nr:MAG: hypothetical protein GQF41_3182 [Candidatus Rifleibacterium amylolyticum]